MKKDSDPVCLLHHIMWHQYHSKDSLQDIIILFSDIFKVYRVEEGGMGGGDGLDPK